VKLCAGQTPSEQILRIEKKERDVLRKRKNLKEPGTGDVVKGWEKALSRGERSGGAAKENGSRAPTEKGRQMTSS